MCKRKTNVQKRGRERKNDCVYYAIQSVMHPNTKKCFLWIKENCIFVKWPNNSMVRLALGFCKCESKANVHQKACIS